MAQTERKDTDEVTMPIKMVRSKRDKLNKIAFLKDIKLNELVNELADNIIKEYDEKLKALAELKK